MRRVAFVVLTVIAGCGVFPQPLPEEPDPSLRIVGGIADSRPYFGTVDSASNETGEFLLASCGCGEWRVLVADSAGQRQFPVQFYAGGADPFAEDVTVYGREDDKAILALLRQSSGQASGEVHNAGQMQTFTAQRGEAHTEDARACVRCHVGEDPIWPQPEGHPAFTLDPANCLDCHEVVIDP
jgi:hypothetical protein